VIWLVPADHRAAASARAAGARFAGLEESRRATLQLLLSELVTNSVRHAGLRATDEIRITIRLAGVVRVEVEDPGPGFEPGATAPREHGGHGLAFVERLAARWGLRRGHPCCVWFELDSGPGDH
jgi:anti-sigma regulatory factor (Ser/Thr protein kinase)